MGACSVRRTWRLAAGVIVAFCLIDNVHVAFAHASWFASLAGVHPAAGVSIWKVAQVVLCFAAALVLPVRGDLRAAAANLGLAHPASRSLGIALGITAPAILVLGFTTRAVAETNPEVLFRTAVASAVAEEVLYRGFLFRQLFRNARWPFWLSALTAAIPFAAGHLYQAGGRGIAGFVEVMVVMGAVSGFAAWVFVRWGDNTWLLIGIHGFANLAWALFVGDGATRMYGWLQYAFLIALITPIVTATLVRRHVPSLAETARSTT